MLAQADLHRSIARLSLNLHQMMEAHEGQIKQFKAGEYEVQFQFNFTGRVGTLPVETVVDMPFGVLFYGDPGTRRNSRLDRPIARLAMEITQGPAGLIPYAHVASWERDNDFNFIGATVRIGFHLPSMAILGAAPPNVAFTGIVHAAFQGYGAPVDPDTILGDGVPATSAFDNYDIGIG